MKKLPRRKLLQSLAAAPLVLGAATAHAEHYPAKLCSDCSFGSKADNCAKCRKWRGSAKVPARLCGEHGFGSKGQNCVSCGKWVGSSKALAYLCSDCGFGSKKDNCMRCGRWAP